MITPEDVRENPHLLIGTDILCPHCNQILEVIKVGTSINACYDPSGTWNEYILLQLEDGEWSRYWFTEYPDPPRNI